MLPISVFLSPFADIFGDKYTLAKQKVDQITFKRALNLNFTYLLSSKVKTRV